MIHSIPESPPDTSSTAPAYVLVQPAGNPDSAPSINVEVAGSESPSNSSSINSESPMNAKVMAKLLRNRRKIDAGIDDIQVNLDRIARDIEVCMARAGYPNTTPTREKSREKSSVNSNTSCFVIDSPPSVNSKMKLD